MLKFIFILAFVPALLGEQFTPIPRRPDGYSAGTLTPKFYLEAWFDLLCPSSFYSYTQLMPVLQKLNFMNNTQLRTTFHVTGFPWYHNSVFFAQVLRFLANNLQNQNDIWTFINASFYNQGKYTNQATINMTDAQVQLQLTNFVHNVLPSYSIQNIALAFTNATIKQEALTSYQYFAANAVSSTPAFWGNGAYINGAANFTTAQWEQFLSQYITIPKGVKETTIEI